MPTVRLLEQGQGTLASFWQVLASLELEIAGHNLPAGDCIGAQIARLRKQRGLASRQLAALVHISPPTLSALETKAQGRLETLANVLHALGARPYLHPIGSPRAFFTHAGNQSLSHRWTTPPALLEKLYPIFGIFDLDPCSPTKNRKHAPVKARLYFTEQENGLTLPWVGTVFVNPPYGGQLKTWIAKAAQEARTNHAPTILALIPARTDTRAWHEHVANQAHIFLLKGRLSFGAGDMPAPFPSALVLWSQSAHHVPALKAAFPDAWYIPPAP